MSNLGGYWISTVKCAGFVHYCASIGGSTGSREDTLSRRCTECGAPFGLIVQRWLSRRFCSKKCLKAHKAAIAEKDQKLMQWLAYLSGK